MYGVNFVVEIHRNSGGQITLRIFNETTPNAGLRSEDLPCFCKLNGHTLEDHPMTCKWLITMVIVFVP